MNITYNTYGSLIEDFTECKECKVPDNCTDCGCDKKCDKLCDDQLMYNKSIKNSQKKINKFLKLIEVKDIEEFNKKHKRLKMELEDIDDKIGNEKIKTLTKDSKIKDIDEVSELKLKISDLEKSKIIIEDLMLNYEFKEEELEIKKLISKNLRKKFNDFRVKFQDKIEKIKKEFNITDTETDAIKRKISNKLKERKMKSNKIREEIENLEILIFEIRKEISGKEKEMKEKSAEVQKLVNENENKCREKICPTDYSNYIRFCLVFQILLIIIIVLKKITR